MAAYVIVQVDVQDEQRYEDYKPMVPPSLEPFGGEFVVRGGDAEPLEGDWDPKRLVVIRFPDRARAKEWLESDVYKDARALRRATAKTQMIVVDGVA